MQSERNGRRENYTPHGLHPHLARIGQTLAFVASLDVIQRQGAIRDNNVLTQREDSEGLICLCPSPHTTSRNKKKAAIPSPKTNIEKKRNKKRFFLSPKNFRKARKKRMESAYRLHRRTCYTKKEPLRRISEVLKVAATYSPTTQCSTIGDAVSRCCPRPSASPLCRAPLRSALSRARAPQARTAHTPHGAHRTP